MTASPAIVSSTPQGTVTLSNREARALALRAQGFGERWRTGRPIEVLERLGALQLDSVSIVARPQDIVPFARTGRYDPAAMYRAIYDQKRGFEYWGHEASWLPMDEYRFFLFRMAQLRGSDWWGRRSEQLGSVLQHVLERIRAEGPLTSNAFEDPRESRGTWWDRKPAKQALEVLFAAGELMCATRTAGFGRMYDLPERVLPAGLDTTDPGAEVSTQHLMRRAFAALGVGTEREAADYFRLEPAERRNAMTALRQQGEVVEVAVEGWKEPAYALPATLETSLRIPSHRPVFLSPFDNLMWQRDRVERLFGFRYRIEIYVPEPKRQYGYYVLPLLAKGRLAGRADFKLDRPSSVLHVRGLWLEGASPDDAASALCSFATHLGASTIDIARVEPNRPPRRNPTPG